MEEGGEELEISDDPHDCRRLDVNSIPVTVTMSKVYRNLQHWCEEI